MKKETEPKAGKIEQLLPIILHR